MLAFSQYLKGKRCGSVFSRSFIVHFLAAISLCVGCEGPSTGTNLIETSGGKPGTGSMGGGGACSAYESIDDSNLLFYLHELVQTAYRPIRVELDQGGNPNRYTSARRLMFTEVERQRGPRNAMVVECIYTGRTATQPATEDPNRDEMNCEHLWPRSLLYQDQDSALYSHQESDLHHLYPSVPGANSLRGNLPFGEVVGDRNMDFSPSYYGVDRTGKMVFDVRRDRRGDVARAMFYMSVRWGLELPDVEADVLRVWNDRDPVSEEETLRNTAVQRLQGNRNPFVDCPTLVDRIFRFQAFRPYDLNGNLPNP